MNTTMGWDYLPNSGGQKVTAEFILPTLSVEVFYVSLQSCSIKRGLF